MAKAKFSFKFFKTKTGHTVLWVVGGLVLFYFVYRYMSGIGGGTVINTSNAGPSDAQIQAEAAQNLATIQANAGVNAAQIQSDAAGVQAGLAAQVALAQVQEQGNEAALAASVANNTITAQTQLGLDSNKTALAQSNVAANTIIAQGTQQNQLLLGQMGIQQQEFNAQLQSSYDNNLLNVAATLKKKSPKSIKYAIAGAIGGVNNTTPYQPASTSSGGSIGFSAAP